MSRHAHHGRWIGALLGAALLAACAGTEVEQDGDSPVEVVGRTMAFQAEDLRGGGIFDLTSLRGEVVLVDFWASWCAPCRESMPFYDDLRRRHEDLEVVAVGIDEERALAERFLEEVPTGLVAVWDEDHAIISRWSVETLPTAFLVDRQGVVRRVHEGFEGDAREAITRQVQELLAEDG